MLKRLFRLFTSPSSPSRPFVYSDRIPDGLGVRAELAGDVRDLAGRLERAWGADFARQVKSRVMSRHPETGEAKYAWMELR